MSLDFNYTRVKLKNIYEYGVKLMDDLIRNTLFIMLIILIFETIWLIKDKKRYTTLLHEMGIFTFMIIMVMVFTITGISPMSGFHMDIRIDEINLVPIVGIINMIQSAIEQGQYMYAVRNVAGNIILFIPVGFLLPLLWKQYRKSSKTITLSILLSLAIECSQLFLSRGTDIDDLILNTIGAVLGYILYTLYKKLGIKSDENHLVHHPKDKNYIIKYGPLIYIVIVYIGIVLLGFYDRYQL